MDISPYYSNMGPKIEDTENFLKEYCAVDLDSDKFFQELYQEHPDFVSACKQVQKDIINKTTLTFRDLRFYLEGFIPTGGIKDITDPNNPNKLLDFSSFIREKIFNVHPNISIREVLESFSGESVHLEEIISLFKNNSKGGNLNTLSDEGVKEIKDFIQTSEFESQKVKEYLQDISRKDDNIFASRLYIFLKRYAKMKIIIGVNNSVAEVLSK